MSQGPKEDPKTPFFKWRATSHFSFVNGRCSTKRSLE